MSKKPLIGLNMGLPEQPRGKRPIFTVQVGYIDAIQRAGGIPFCVPPSDDPADLDRAIALLDGFCFIGGPDYDPRHYGGRTQSGEQLMDPRRDRSDVVLAEKVLKRTPLPVLGVCGGHQLISITYGGSLVQDIRTEWRAKDKRPLPHSSDGRAIPNFSHEVNLDPDTLIAKVTGAGKVVATNSYHHQAVHPEHLGEGLRASAWAEDGVVEALEPAPGSALYKSGRFVLGVQWHPELMPDAASAHGIFSALVNAAKKT